MTSSEALDVIEQNNNGMSLHIIYTHTYTHARTHAHTHTYTHLF